VFMRAGGFFGSINQDTFDAHENVAYSVAFRTLLAVSKVLKDEAIRTFAYEGIASADSNISGFARTETGSHQGPAHDGRFLGYRLPVGEC